jgi:hypothetical protein
MSTDFTKTIAGFIFVDINKFLEFEWHIGLFNFDDMFNSILPQGIVYFHGMKMCILEDMIDMTRTIL